MATPIRMPDIGTAADMIRVVRWIKQVGDPVQRGEALCEVETDKAVSELESYAAGVLLQQAVPADTQIEQGTIIAWIGASGETIPAGAAAGQPDAAPKTEPVPPPAGAGTPAVPLMIRNLAKELDVDLSQVKGSGPGGKITREDLQRAKPSGAAGQEETAALSRNQAAVARRVAASQREIPPINLVGRIGMRAAMNLRQELQIESGQKIPYDAIFIHAVARILGEFPHFRSQWQDERLQVSPAVHIGCAVDTNGELFIPVIRNADRKPPVAIARELQELVDKARRGALTLEEMKEGCLTISNLGMYPVRHFTVIIPPGQSSGLTIGAIEEQLALQDGQPVARPVCHVTLAVDHRLINGREAAEFLQRFKSVMEAL
ncbi:MAG: dihydrolipoamide acetyltransferase family protein [Opitutaceae bacterium]|nr:dihydrolipoamide acetyltransferase family protein [Opitutaceae bacterium]